MDDREVKLQVIMKEWDHVHDINTRYGGIIMTIRGWAITLFSALFVVAFQQDLASVLLFGVAPMVLFWYFDATYHGIQRLFRERQERIEDHLLAIDANSLDQPFSPTMMKEFKQSSKLDNYIREALLQRNRIILYGSMISIFLFSFIMLKLLR